jgi:molybdenum cofactor cytidylyltransferase
MVHIGAVILAAGESLRFGRPKQLVQLRGKTFVRGIVDAATDAGCSPIVVVIGSDRDEVTRELKETGVIIVQNENWQRGIGTSIRAGVQSLIDAAPDLEAIVALVCDQPFLDARTIEQLIKLLKKTKKAIVASSYADTLGVPAIFDRSCFQELLALDDKNGAKKIILLNHERVAEFSFPKGKIDIDTEAELEEFTNGV